MSISITQRIRNRMRGWITKAVAGLRDPWDEALRAPVPTSAEWFMAGEILGAVPVEVNDSFSRSPMRAR
jgi:hypothetical protein